MENQGLLKMLLNSQKEFETRYCCYKDPLGVDSEHWDACCCCDTANLGSEIRESNDFDTHLNRTGYFTGNLTNISTKMSCGRFTIVYLLAIGSEIKLY